MFLILILYIKNFESFASKNRRLNDVLNSEIIQLQCFLVLFEEYLKHYQLFKFSHFIIFLRVISVIMTFKSRVNVITSSALIFCIRFIF